jgi:NADH:ubiquinone oxidoreductase subunit K
MSLPLILLFSALLFALGLTIALSRRNAVLILIGTELMLAAANINFLAFWRFGDNPDPLTGVLFALFALAVAAAEAAVGLAIIVLVYRHSHSADPEHARVLRG